MDETPNPNPGAPSQVPPQVIDGFQFSGLATHWRARRILDAAHQVHPLYWGANPNGTHASMWPLEDFSLGEIHRRWGGGVYQIAPMRRMTNGKYVFCGGWTPAIQLQGEPKPSPFSIPMTSLDAARDEMPGAPDPLDEDDETESDDDETDEDAESDEEIARTYEPRRARRGPDLTMAFSGDFPAELKTAMGLYSFITNQTIAQFAIHEERQRLAHEEQLQRLQQYHGQTLQLLQSARTPRTDPALVEVLGRLSETLEREEPEPSYPAQIVPQGTPMPGPPGMPGMPGMPMPPSGPPTVATQITDLINGLGNLLDRVPQEVRDEAFRRMFARFAPTSAK